MQVPGPSGNEPIPEVSFEEQLKQLTEGFQDVIQSATGQNLGISLFYDSSGNFIIQIAPPADGMSIAHYHQALEEFLIELESFLKEIEITDAKLDRLFSVYVVAEQDAILALGQQLIQLTFLIDEAEAVATGFIDDHNTNVIQGTYYDGFGLGSFDLEIDAYKDLGKAMQTYLDSNKGTNATNAYFNALNTYNSIKNGIHFGPVDLAGRDEVLDSYNNGVATYNQDKNAINDQLDVVNSLLDTYNSFIEDVEPGKVITNRFPPLTNESTVTPMFAAPTGLPTQADADFFKDDAAGMRPEPANIDRSLYTRSTLFSGVSFDNIGRFLKRPNRLREALELAKNIKDLSENLLDGVLRFKVAPDFQPEVELEKTSEGTPTSGVGMPINAMGGRIDSTKLNAAFATGLVEKSGASTQIPIPPALFDALQRLGEDLLNTTSIGAAISTVQELKELPRTVQPSSQLADLTLILNFAEKSTEQLSRNTVSNILSSTGADDDAVDATLEQIQLTRLLLALLVITETLGIPGVAVSVFRSLEGVPSSDLLEATDLSATSFNDLLNDPTTSLVIQKDLSQIAPGSEKEIGGAIDDLATKEEITESRATSSFINKGLDFSTSQTLAQGAILALNNEISSPFLDAEFKFQGDRAAFLGQFDTSQQPAINQAITDGRSLREVRDNVVSNVGGDPIEARETANDVISRLQPQEEINRQALVDSLGGDEAAVNAAFAGGATTKAELREALGDKAVIATGTAGPLNTDQLRAELDTAIQPHIKQNSTRADLADRGTKAIKSIRDQLNEIVKDKPHLDQIKDFTYPDRELVTVPLTSLNIANQFVDLGSDLIGSGFKKTTDIETGIPPPSSTHAV